MSEPSIRDRAAAHGIAGGYWDIWGTHHMIPSETDERLLRAMDVDPTLGSVAPTWQRMIPAAVAARVGKEIALTIVTRRERLEEAHRWELIGDGLSVDGEFRPADLDWDADGPGGLLRYRWELPAIAVPGYLELTVTPSGADSETSTVMVAPERCPPVPETERRVWGLAIQLYGLRGARDWGIGDFGCLGVAVEALAGMGADLVGINPLHLLFPDDPAQASPYSPSSRLLLNPWYIDVDAVPEVIASPAAQSLMSGGSFAAERRRLRALEAVDHAGVAALKRAVLERAWTDFGSVATADRASELAAFRECGGEDLKRAAIFCALRESAAGSDPATWPAELRDPESDAVQAFAEEETSRVGFHVFLQWLADQQLAGVAARARAMGMAIGLYGDLALGSAGGGAEVWSAPDAHARGASLGAPPDDFSPRGQDWGLAPLVPDPLTRAEVRHFADVLRATMRHLGAIRIDHVMGLRRAFWIPEGAAPIDGAYVDYPFDEMLAVVCLESSRADCVVIGEDLGTVPDEIRDALAGRGVLSYRVLWFEKDWDGDGVFRPPGDWPEQALATASTHDLPTIAGFWGGRDLAHRERLSLFPDEETRERLVAERERDRHLLVDRLRAEGLIGEEGDPAPEDLRRAIHRLILGSRSQLAVVQLEDLLGDVEQANLPGTASEHPNWCRRYRLPVEDWSGSGEFRKFTN